MKTLFKIAMLLVCNSLLAQGFGTFKGKIVDQDFKDPLIGAGIHYFQGSEIIKGSINDEGRFEFLDLRPGTYTFYITYLIDTMKITGVEIKANEVVNKPNLEFSITEIIVEQDLIDLGDVKTDEMTDEMIMRSASKNDLSTTIATMSSTISKNERGESFFKGSRSNGMLYFVDGIKTTYAPSMPAQSLKNLRLYSGGLPAKYGDTLGGVVEIESKSYMELWQERNNP